MIENLVDWVKLRYYLWKHRNDTPEQRHEAFEKAKRELVFTIDKVKEEFSDDPATKELHEIFDSLDTVKKELGVE